MTTATATRTSQICTFIKAWPNARNIFNATSCNIVGHNMLHTIGDPVAICCNMLDDVGSNLKTVKFFVQHFGCCMMFCTRLATFTLLFTQHCWARACALGPLLARQGPGAHEQ